MLELALGDARFEFDGETVLACGGAGANSTLNNAPLTDYTAYFAERGDVLMVRATGEARFTYLAFAGGIDCEQLLGSRSTYLPGGWGGIGGRSLARGDRIALQRKRHAPPRVPLPDALRPSRDTRPIRIVPRSPSHQTTLTSLVESSFTMSRASDRTGYRLDGAAISGGASIVSEPVCPGVIQLPPGGQPIVLMADAPTIGGYKSLGCVITADRSMLAQIPVGSGVAFEIISIEQAESARVQQDLSLTAVEAWFRLTLREESSRT